jgi:hypothetical protein
MDLETAPCRSDPLFKPREIPLIHGSIGPIAIGPPPPLQRREHSASRATPAPEPVETKDKAAANWGQVGEYLVFVVGVNGLALILGGLSLGPMLCVLYTAALSWTFFHLGANR